MSGQVDVNWSAPLFGIDAAPDKVSGLNTLMQDGVTFKYLREPLSAAQVLEVIRIPAPLK